MEKRVIGFGGIFFKCKDVAATKKWYATHLGLDTDDYGCTFWNNTKEKTSQQWSPFKEETTYFKPSDHDYMINYKVHDLDNLLIALKQEGVTVVGTPESHDYGKFAWIMDIDNRKIELWEPKNEGLFEK